MKEVQLEETHNLKYELKERLKTLCDETSMHGLFQVANRDKWYAKFLWILIVIVGVTATIYCK
jgi:hypothetical protein